MLVVDLPPGTGDIQLTIAQRLKVDGVVIVSTPQEIALIDARRAVTMFQKMGTEILGVVEQHDLIQKNKALKQDNETKSKELGALARLAVTNRSQIAIMLHKRGLINAQQVQELHRLQQTRKEPVIRVILERDWVPEKQIHDILRRELLVEEVDLKEISVDPAVAALIPFDAGCRAVLEGTFPQALRLGHNYIGTEHILLALLEREEGDGGPLTDTGVDRAAAETTVIAEVSRLAAAL